VAAARLAYRVSNTARSAGELAGDPRAILLENALVDTARPLELGIPEPLRAGAEPGSYIVQRREGISAAAFQALLASAGARVVSYIPNNSWLVRASAGAARQLEADGRVGAVLPYAPYYKLKSTLLGLAVRGEGLPGEGGLLRVLLFADGEAAAERELGALGVAVLGREGSPFGPVLRVRVPPGRGSLAGVAAVAGVQAVEWAPRRVAANDLSRAGLGVAIDPVEPTNYLGLSGLEVTVNVNDTGVDAQHPDLAGRVLGEGAGSGVDTNGHGTHVAGIIAGSGEQSGSVSAAPGSPLPPVQGQFRGKAPQAKIYSMVVGLEGGPADSDGQLQERTARSPAFISNNSWHYERAPEYDLGAASYDAAVRDALPGETGSQPLVYVFGAGNAGGADDNGTGGAPDSIQSPATAKNVITVGASELAREITNEVWKCTGIVTGTNNADNCQTNTPWRALTDAADQVAGFSSRGNVGVGLEGDFGRFKPDVVAPGTFVVSTRSTQWDQDAYYNPTSHQAQLYRGLTLTTNNLWINPIFIPDNAVQLTVRLIPNNDSPTPLPDLPIYVSRTTLPSPDPGGYDFMAMNEVTTPPDGGTLDPRGISWFFGIGNNTGVPISVDLRTDIVVTNDLGNYMEVLRGMNEGLGRYYRYESGSSVAAAQVSGTLALIQEFFERRLQRPASPALMKALLISGARSLGNLYDLQVSTPLNAQGWGLTRLPHSLHASLTNNPAPGGAVSMVFYDQSPAEALATGQSRTRYVRLSGAAQTAPLRMTLVWTDPPGNPVASLKLVNNLDLVVTNLDTGQVFVGNDLLSGNDFNLPWDTNGPPNYDLVNNVERVLLSPLLGTNYSVTVVGRRVNVNAVSAAAANELQDYALVIASGDGEVAEALTVTEQPVRLAEARLLTILTNSFTTSPQDVGGILLGQRVGANAPTIGLNNTVPASNTVSLMGPVGGLISLGTTNQWHFYAFTNTTTYTNAAFLTFLPPTLGLPRAGVNQERLDNSTRPEADIDLYVSRDPGLLRLEPGAVAGAFKSLGRGGTETFVSTNATPGVYYVGVKAEDQQAAEYGFLGVFSLLPFADEDAQGNLRLRGFPAPALIPDGTPRRPQGAYIFGIAPKQLMVRRVTVTNSLTHALMGDLLGTLSHGSDQVVLNNHSPNAAVTNRVYVYDDSDEGNVPFSRRTDGPGSLEDFGGRQGVGQWMLTQVDNSPDHTGTNNYLFVFLEKQQDLTNGVSATIEPGQCRRDFVEVPPEATNLTVVVSVVSGAGPMTLQVCPPGVGGCQSTVIQTNGAVIRVDKSSVPPLNPGVYTVRVCNEGSQPVTVNIRAILGLDLSGVRPITFRTSGPTPIRDEAITTVSLPVTNDQKIVSLEVGLRVDHPRVSDLAFTLVSPQGTRALLFENRGGVTASGLGSGDSDYLTFTENTNRTVTPIKFATPPFNGTATSLRDISGFETVTPGDYTAPTTVDGWTVVSNNVSVLTGPGLADTGNNSLNLQDGRINRTLATTPGRSYTLRFASRQAPLMDGLIAWWPLEDGGADIVGGHNGAVTNNPNFVPGEVGRAINLTDRNQGVIVPDRPDLNFGAGADFSIEAWIRPLVAQTDYGVMNIVDKRITPFFGNDAVALGYEFCLANGRLTMQLSDSLSNPFLTATGGNDLRDGSWHHVAVTINRASTAGGRLYVDGQLVNTFDPTSKSGDLTTTAPLLIGMHPSPWLDCNFRGNLDEVSLYNRALETAEIQAIVAAGKAGKCGLPVPPPVCIGAGTQVLIDGQLRTTINGSPAWQNNSVTFVASQPSTRLELAPEVGVSGILLDSFKLAETSGGVYYLPEESLEKLRGENALGVWTLEIWDNRAGGNVPPPRLLGWQMEFQFETVLPTPIPLEHNTPITNSVGPGQIVYLMVDVPNWAKFATNWLIFASEPVNVLFNQNRLPSGTNGPGDLTLFANSTGGTRTLTAGAGAPPLVPGARYYLGIQNRGTNRVDFGYQVDFDVTPLTNRVPVSSMLAAGPLPRYFSYDVSPNAASVTFELLSLSGNAQLVARRGLPFPDLVSNDYAGLNAGTNDELILVTSNSVPQPLTPGRWYLGVFNEDAQDVNYTILATETNTAPSTNVVIIDYEIISNRLCITWLSEPGTSYFVQGKVDIMDTNWTTISPTILATGPTTTYCIQLPTPYHFFRVLVGAAGGLTTLEPGVPVTNSVAPGEIRYYLVNVPSLASFATNGLIFADAPVNLLYNQTNLPSGTNGPGDFTLLTGSQAGIATLSTTNGTPLLVAGTNYFLGVQNTNPVTATFALQVDFDVVTSTNIVVVDYTYTSNGLCLTWTSVAGSPYYVEGKTDLMSTNWVPVSPTIIATGPLTTYCVPLPSPYSFFRVRAGTAPGSLVGTPVDPFVTYTNTIPAGEIRYYSVDVPDWSSLVTNALLSATLPVDLVFNQNLPPGMTNGSGDFTLLGNATNGVSTLSASGTPPVIAPGRVYYLGVRNTNAADATIALRIDFEITPLTNGVPFSSAQQTGRSPRYFSFEVSTNSAAASFQLLALSGNLDLVARKAPALPTRTVFDYASLRSGTNSEAILIGTNSAPTPLSPGTWFAGVYNVDTNRASYTILATESASPVVSGPVIVDIVFSSTNLCITWASTPGATYIVDGLVDLSSTNWAPVSGEILATAATTTYCVSLPSPYMIYRVRTLSTPGGPTIVQLQPGVAQTNTVPAGEMQYYSVDVPAGTTFATNALLSAAPPIDLLFNQDTLPFMFGGPGDFTLLVAATNGVAALAADGSTTPSITAGQTYYLGVRNTNTSSATVALRVDLVAGAVTNPVLVGYTVSVTNLCLTWTSVAGGTYLVEGKADLVGTNWTAVSGTIIALGSQASHCVDLPSPYAFFRVRALSIPSDPTITALQPGVPQAGAIPAGAVRYFSVDVPTGTGFATNTLVSASTPVNLVFNQNGIPNLTNGPGDFTLLGGATNGVVILSPTGAAPALAPGRVYYLAVRNTNATPADFELRVDLAAAASTSVVVGYQLTSSNLCLTWTSIVGATYAVEGKVDVAGTNWASVSGDLIATNTVTGYCVSLPSPFVFFRVRTVSVPSAPTVIPLQSGVSHTNTVPAGALRFYSVDVPSGMSYATNRLLTAAAPVDLLFNQNTLPSGAGGAGDFALLTSATNGGVTLSATGAPPILAPGRLYYLAVRNTNTTAVDFVVRVDLAAAATSVSVVNYQITSTNLCLTWTSVAGASYVVEGLTDLGSTNWAPASGSITANGPSTTHCITFPSPFLFFRVRGGNTSDPGTGQVTISDVTSVAGGMRLQWQAPATNRFNVQWTAAIVPPDWKSFTNTVTSATGAFSFVDDGSQATNSPGLRFYRLLLLP
jgi:subtilisin-like proprotein convertase family protein